MVDFNDQITWMVFFEKNSLKVVWGKTHRRQSMKSTVVSSLLKRHKRSHWRFSTIQMQITIWKNTRKLNLPSFYEDNLHIWEKIHSRASVRNHKTSRMKWFGGPRKIDLTPLIKRQTSSLDVHYSRHYYFCLLDTIMGEGMGGGIPFAW